MTIEFSNKEELVTLSENVYSGTIRLHGSDKFLNLLTEFHKKQLHNSKFNPEDIRGFKKTFDGFSFEASVKSNPVETELLGYYGNTGLLEKCFDNYLGYKANDMPIETYNKSVDTFYEKEECSKITITRINDPQNGLVYKTHSHSYGGQVSTDWCYKNGLREGYCRQFDLSRLMTSNEHYSNDVKHGKSVIFNSLTDKIKERLEYNYVNGEKFGTGVFSEYKEEINSATRKVERVFICDKPYRSNFSSKKNPYLTQNNKEKKGRSL